MQNKKRHHVYDVYYSFFDKYKGHNQVVSTLVLYFGGPEFKYEPEDWLLWEAMIQYRQNGDAATLTNSDLVQSIHKLVTTCIYNIYGLFNSTVNNSHYVALNDKIINE